MRLGFANDGRSLETKKPPHSKAQYTDNSDKLEQVPKPKEEQKFIDNSEHGQARDISGDLGTDSVRKQSDFAGDDGVNDVPDQGVLNPDLKPRHVRKPKRPANEIGLGTSEELATLVKIFIQLRHEHFPELIKQGLEVAMSEAIVDLMVEDLKSRHDTGIITDVDQAIAESGMPYGGCYLRFSDANSQSRSITDQLRKVMQRGASDGVVPLWSLLFVDYARSAVYDYRPGFEGLLKRLRAKEGDIQCIYLDEFGRGSRRERDSWRLASLCKREKIGLVSASDSFTLASEDWDTWVSMYNTFNRMEKKYKGLRVRRGMEGAAADNQVLGLQTFGFTRLVKRDVCGNVVTGNKDEPVHVRAIDPEAAEIVKQIFRWAIVEKWSAYKIAHELNDHKVDDWDRWEPSGIIKILVNPAYIGMFIWGRKTKDYNYETEKYEDVEQPWQDWVVCYDKTLALIPKAWHVQMRAKYEKNRPGKPGPKRLPDRVAVTLFSKALKCGYCGGDIKLFRSQKKYKNMYCPNGPKCARGCKLSVSKSVRIIETCLLDYIHTHLLTEDVILDLLKQANAYLVEQAEKPKADVSGEKARLRQLEKRVDKLMDRIEGTDDDNLLAAYDKRILKLQRETAALRKFINQTEAANAPVPPPLDLDQVQTYLADLRDLLNQAIPASAEAIAELTGPIKITQEKIPGMKTKAKWIATFSPDFLGLLTQLGASKNYPECKSLEFLYRANWTIQLNAMVVIEKVPNYECMGQKYKALHDDGVSISEIAAAHGTTWLAVNQAIQFVETGERPKFKSGKRTGKQAGKTPKYKLIAEDVSRLKAQWMSIPKIIDWLAEHRGIKVGEGTVRRAWNHANPDAVKRAVDERKPPSARAKYRHLPPEKIERIKAMFAEGRPVRKIAETMGCSASTIYRLRRAS